MALNPLCDKGLSIAIFVNTFGTALSAKPFFAA